MIKVTNLMGQEIPVKFWKFPAGEVGVKVLTDTLPKHLTVTVYEDYSSDTIMQLFMLSNALDIVRRELEVTLVMPYLPYSRQDRVCSEGEANSKKQLLLLLKLYYPSIVTMDAHSGAHSQYYENVEIDINSLVSKYKATAVVFPDTGAFEKYYSKLPNIKHAYGVKRRDSEGNITNYELVSKEELSSNDIVLVVDDICDGGKTFLELAKLLPKTKERHLHVTHGIFSKGIEILEAEYDSVNCINKVKSHV